MKRDWELLGKIFQHIEDETIEDFINDNNLSEETRHTILRHIELLADADYIRGIEVVRGSIGLNYRADEPRITLQGYDFADVVLDQKLLKKVQNAIVKAGYLVTWETIKAFAPTVLKEVAKTIF